MRRVSVGVMAAIVAGSALGRAAEAPSRQRVVAGERYRAAGLHRLLLGDDYRDLWTMPVELPVLDLQRYAGGLRPVRRVGGQQTKGLALEGADGRDYTFRGVDKDPTEILPPELREGLAKTVIQDQIASAHPAAAVVVPPILEAAGVLHSSPELVVMPDDPALGEFRPVFAGLVGTIEEFPQPAGDGNPGFAGATEIIDGEELWRRLQASAADRIDARAFLRARLTDIVLGDWDRHRGQWRWARIPGRSGWQPIPEDRDQAFVRFEGLLLDLTRRAHPRLVDFGPAYSRIEGQTFNGWEVDRRLLAELDAASFEEAGRDLQRRLTDAVLEAAVAGLPAEYREHDGPRLLLALRARRDALPAEARRYYRHLAREVDVYATDGAERVDLSAQRDGAVEVALRDGSEAAPYFRRTVRPEETVEVRVHLGGGDDRVIAHGPASPILVRVVGGAGCEVVQASGGPRVRVADTEPCTEVTGASIDRAPYVRPPLNPRAPWIPPRDWGATTLVSPWLGAGPEVGAFLGAGLTRQTYGFRKDPYASRQRLRAGYATGAGAGRVDYLGRFRRENSRTLATVFVRASGIEILRFYGLGNETASASSDDVHEVAQQQYLLAPALAFDLGDGADVEVGPIVQYATTSLLPGRLITALRPYGTEDFGQVGGRLGLVVDRRDRAGAPTRGALLRMEARAFPAVWSVRRTFGSLRAEGATYLTPGLSPRPTLALRAGIKRVWGEFPFHEAAYIGGAESVRGLRAERFGGEAAAYGSAELRLALGHFVLLLPGDVGLFALGDAGRVWVNGESSRRWHTAWGGGVWFSFLERSNTLTLAVARSEERTGVYVSAGFAF
ncbi:MAG TPA: BamA/TamA family outer membrane protein [Vicinamibacteria bacterium]|nr:BamA/TamA family outer membrane protein [Vicinamibacteria bacterium]